MKCNYSTINFVILHDYVQWAQFPPIQYKEDGPDGESCTCSELREENVAWESDMPEVN